MENVEITDTDQKVIARLNKHFCSSSIERQEEKENIRLLMIAALQLEPKDLHALGVAKRQVMSLSARLFLGLRNYIPKDEEMILKVLS